MYFEFVSGILVFVAIEGAPGPEGFLTLRPRLAEVSPVEPALAPYFNHEPLELAHAKLGVL